MFTLLRLSLVPFQLSFPPTTATGWLVILGLVLFAAAYVGVCSLVAVWVYRDAGRTGRARPALWAGAVGASLVATGLVGLFLLAAYLWGRESHRARAAVE